MPEKVQRLMTSPACANDTSWFVRVIWTLKMPPQYQINLININIYIYIYQYLYINYITYILQITIYINRFHTHNIYYILYILYILYIYIYIYILYIIYIYIIYIYIYIYIIVSIDQCSQDQLQAARFAPSWAPSSTSSASFAASSIPSKGPGWNSHDMKVTWICGLGTKITISIHKSSTGYSFIVSILWKFRVVEIDTSAFLFFF